MRPGSSRHSVVGRWGTRRLLMVSMVPVLVIAQVLMAASVSPERDVGVGRDRAELAATVETGLVAARPACRLSAKLVPTCPGVLTGAFVLPRSGESAAEAVRRHEVLTQTPMAIVHNYYRGARLFPSDEEKRVLGRGGSRRLLLANWKPEDGYTWRQVADGAADGVIRAEARHLKATFDKKMFLAVHHEPENEVIDSPGSGFEARDYRAMYRHVVDVFRAEGATKVVWVMNYMGAQKWALASWYDDLYPGGRYVDWLAFDPYKTPTLGGQTGGFNSLVNQHYGLGSWRGAYRWARTTYPNKPVMLAEWGIGERPGDPDYKARLFSQIAPKLHLWPNLRALVYFDSYDADVAGDVSITTSPSSLVAFQGFVTSPQSLQLPNPRRPGLVRIG